MTPSAELIPFRSDFSTQVTIVINPAAGSPVPQLSYNHTPDPCLPCAIFRSRQMGSTTQNDKITLLFPPCTRFNMYKNIPPLFSGGLKLNSAQYRIDAHVKMKKFQKQKA